MNAASFLVLLLLGGPRPVAGGTASRPDAEMEAGAAAATASLAADLVNADRRRHGLPALVRDPALDEIAAAHSLDMSERATVAHVSPTTGTPERRLLTAGYSALESGENVGRGSAIDELERELLLSPGHRANLLSPRFTHLGIGVARTGSGRESIWYLTQTFARRAPPFDATRWSERVRSAVAARRARAKVAALAPDPALDQLAASAAEDAVRSAVPVSAAKPDGRTSPDTVRLDHALSAAVDPRRGGVVWGTVETLGEIEQLEVPAPLLRQSFRRFGVGVAYAPGLPPPNVMVVLLAGE